MSGKSGSDRTSRGRPFEKGRSGNPRGRPRKEHLEDSSSAFDVIIDKMLAVTQDGEPREVAANEALHLKIYQDAIAGKVTAQRKVLKWIEKREKYRADRQKATSTPSVALELEPVDPTNADEAMVLLGIACENPDRLVEDRTPLLLETWAVQVALRRRRGGASLTEQDCANIRRCTLNADKLQWPRGTES